MQKLLVKILSVLGICLLGIGLCSCKGKETVEENYIYLAETEILPVKTGGENSYVNNYFITDGKFIYNLVEYEMNNDTYEVLSLKNTVYITDLVDGTEKSFVMSELPKNSYLQEMYLRSDGNIGAILNTYDEKTYESTYAIVSFNDKGEMVGNVDITKALNEAGSTYIGTVVIDKDGNLYSANDSLLVLSPNGEMLLNLRSDTWFDSIFKLDDGSVYVATYNRESMNEEVRLVDVKNKKLGDAIKLPMSNCSYYSVGDGKIVLSSDTKTMLYDFNSGESEELWSWLDLDVEGSNISTLAKDKDKYVVIYDDWSEADRVIYKATIRKEIETPENHKEVLTLGCLYSDYQISNAVKMFNKANTKYKIKMVVYYDDGDTEWETAQQNFDMDIASGKLDIVDLSSDESLATKYMSQGALTDLNPYLDNDPDIKREELFDNVLRASEIDGKLPFITHSFSVETMMVNSDYIDVGDSWTLEQFVEARKKYPDKEFISYADKLSILYYCILFGGDDFVDYSNGTCSFDSQEFIDVLNLANSFPSADQITYSDDYDSWEAIQNGDVLVEMITMGDTSSYYLYKTLMGGHISIPGFPSSNGNGNAIMPQSMMGMSSSCKNKDAAWSFLKILLSEEFEKDNGWGTPMIRSLFDKKLDDAVKKEQHSSYGNGNTVVEIKNITSTEAEEIKKIVSESKNLLRYDEKVYDIIEEESGAFFAGSKSANDVATVIQSRVKIYLQEQR